MRTGPLDYGPREWGVFFCLTLHVVRHLPSRAAVKSITTHFRS